MAELDPQLSSSPPRYTPPGYTSSLPTPTAPPPTAPPPSLCASCNHPLPNRLEDFNQPLPGWPKLAEYITNHPGLEAFPSFRDLNIKSLLYYQAELQWLRKKLHRQEWFDLRYHREYDGCEDDDLPQRVDHLLLSKKKDDENARKQIDLITEIREVLEKYSVSPTIFTFQC